VFSVDELEKQHEILGEPIRIPSYGLVENPCLNSVKFGHKAIKLLLEALEMDGAFAKRRSDAPWRYACSVES
jgi:hypothetical protein